MFPLKIRVHAAKSPSTSNAFPKSTTFSQVIRSTSELSHDTLAKKMPQSLKPTKSELQRVMCQRQTNIPSQTPVKTTKSGESALYPTSSKMACLKQSTDHDTAVLQQTACHKADSSNNSAQSAQPVDATSPKAQVPKPEYFAGYCRNIALASYLGPGLQIW